MSKEIETRKQEPKQPLKVEVKVALPWTLIIFAIAVFVSHVNGWNMRSADVSRVKAEAHSIVDISKVPSKE